MTTASQIPQRLRRSGSHVITTDKSRATDISDTTVDTYSNTDNATLTSETTDRRVRGVGSDGNRRPLCQIVDVEVFAASVSTKNSILSIRADRSRINSRSRVRTSRAGLVGSVHHRVMEDKVCSIATCDDKTTIG